MGTRLCIGYNNDDLINHKLACKLDEIATTVQNTNQLLENILFAMLHLALHYECGIWSSTKVILMPIDITNQVVIDHPFSW